MYLAHDLIKQSGVSFPKFNFGKAQTDIEKAIQAFLTGKVGKFGKYIAVPNALIYRTMIDNGLDVAMKVAQNVVAIRIDRPDEVLFIGNSSRLPLLQGNVSDVQTELSKYIQMVPFGVFIEAGLNLNNIRILDRGPEETVVRNEREYDAEKEEHVNVPVTVHFTGASLFQVDDKMFLFDIDRREIDHKVFNPFLVQLQVPARTIAEAYQTLKPQAVLDAESKGLTVLRQGEWFFIPVQGDFKPVMDDANSWRGQRNDGKATPQPLELRAGRNRPNTAEMYTNFGKTKYVTGKVSHSGREHADLILKGWFEAVPNTSIQSFTLTGDVD